MYPELVSWVGLVERGESLPNLETLYMAGCRELSNDGLVEILKISESKLRYLHVSWIKISEIVV